MIQGIALQLSAGSQLGLHAVAALATVIAGCQVHVMMIIYLKQNIATGETSQAITPFHFFDYLNYSNFHKKRF